MRDTNQKCATPQSEQLVDGGETKRPSVKGARAARTKAQEIDWRQWWPFDRATGTALRQLNRKPKQEYEEALL